MKRLMTALAILLAGTVGVRGADSSPAYNFLNIAQSTSAYGLGGVNISSIDDDVNMIDGNPALLGPEMEKAIGVNYMYYIGKSNFAGAKFANRASDHSAWGIGVQYYGYGSIAGYDENGVAIGDFSPKDMALSGYYSHDIHGYWRGGVALKFLYSTYDSYSAIALATDIGINYFDPEKDLSFSVVVANLGGQVKRFTDSYDRLPFDIRMGLTTALGSLPVRLSVTATHLTEWNLPYWDAGDGTEHSQMVKKDSFFSNLFRHLVFGLDFVPSDRFHIGIGYNYKTRTDMATYSRNLLSGFSACAGLRAGKFGVGVAFAKPHAGATTFMVNLTTSINDFIK